MEIHTRRSPEAITPLITVLVVKHPSIIKSIEIQFSEREKYDLKNDGNTHATPPEAITPLITVLVVKHLPLIESIEIQFSETEKYALKNHGNTHAKSA